MKTIAKNRTKFLAKLATEFTQCRMYDQSSGEMVVTDPRYAWKALADSAHARLTESSDGSKYTVHVHSNRWYELRRGGSA